MVHSTNHPYISRLAEMLVIAVKACVILENGNYQ